MLCFAENFRAGVIFAKIVESLKIAQSIKVQNL